MKSVTDMLRDAGKTKAAESIESKQSERKPPSVFRKPNPVARKIDKGRSSPSDPISKSIESKQRSEKESYSKQEFIDKVKKQEDISRSGLESLDALRQQRKDQSLPGSGFYTFNFGKKEISLPYQAARYVFTKESEQLEISRRSVEGLPDGSRIVRKNDGFEVRVPDSARLSGTTSFLEKTKNLNPIYSGIIQFSSGVQSSLAAIGKPVASLFGKGKDFDMAISLSRSRALNPFSIEDTTVDFVTGMKNIQIDQHYISPFDFAFEPIGWSPKGSTKVMTDYPVFTAGGVAGEVAQSLAFTEAFKGVGLGVKGVAKRTPTVYSKLSREFPQVFSTFTTESGKTVGSRTGIFINKIGQKPIASNFMKWATKGYKPGKTLVWRSLGRNTDDIVGTRFTKGVYKPVKGSRQFMSPVDFAKYESKLAASGKIKIGFPRRVGDDILFAGEGEKISKSIFGNRIKNKLVSVTKSKYVGYDVPLTGKTYTRPGLGSFKRSDVKSWIMRPVTDDSFEKSSKAIYGKSVREMWKEGYPYKFTNLESGKQIVDFTSGFGKSSFLPEPKSWINKTKTGLLKSKEASVRLVGRTRQVFKTPSWSVKSKNVLGTTMKVPSRSGFGIVSSVLFSGFRVGSGIGSMSALKPVTMNVFDYRSGFDTVSVPRSVQVRKPVSSMDSMNISAVRLDVGTRQSQYSSLKLDTALSTKKVTVKSPMPSSYNYGSSGMGVGVPFLYPARGMSARGTSGYAERLLGTRYRYREFKVPSLKKLFGGMKL